MKNYNKRVSDFMLEKIFEYYLSMEKGKMQNRITIAENIGCSEFTLSEFLKSIDNTKDVNGEFSNIYKLVLSHTIFRKETSYGSHWMNQQEYFQQLEQKRQRHIKAKEQALSLYRRQQNARKGIK